MIDIHCHILPSLDDGAFDETTALQMAQEAVASGIQTVIATPHHKNRTYENDKATIQREVTQFKQVLKEHAIALDVLPGQEVRIFGELLADFNQGEIQTLNDSKYLLLELPSDHVPQYTKQLIFDMQQAGLIPVIAHPERNRDLYTEPNQLYDFIRQGALAQVTAGSLTGVFGKEIQRVSMQMIQHHLIHFIASDAHNVKTRNFTSLKEAYDLLDSEDPFISDQFKENAQYLLNNENINQNEPMKIAKKKRFFGLF